MKNNPFFVLVPLMIMLIAAPGRAGTVEDNTAQVLELGAGAVQPALGGSGQASVRGPAALQYNPAGLAPVDSRELEITYQSLVENIKYGNLDLSQQLSTNSAGALGVRFLEYGSVDRTEVSGGEVVDVGSFNDSDFVFSGGLAGKYGSFKLGATARLLRVELAGSSEQTKSFDVGGQWGTSFFDHPIDFGVTVRNLGGGLKFENEREELPRLITAGTSLHLEPSKNKDIRLHCDLQKRGDNSESYLRLGGEFIAQEITTLRLGYDQSLDVDNGLTYGIGFSHPDYQMRLDYALVPYGGFGELHRLSFTFNFSGRKSL